VGGIVCNDTYVDEGEHKAGRLCILIHHWWTKLYL